MAVPTGSYTPGGTNEVDQYDNYTYVTADGGIKNNVTYQNTG